ncbi:TetR family transcriptional regulator [Mycolicibacter heraklionensis]|uniref:TetR family transcriptional regulator n=1 Tax=Mycolicibacter heraklionensis TaxID=512402 RepID=A0ABR5FF72_9MYCO|nr:TetR/AcrR family transcriptional regulator [Mycolicibacter heraklionensis]KLO28761.1 TetR family transcriptional regulator [Mycolicibacter heraklionensis]
MPPPEPSSAKVISAATAGRRNRPKLDPDAGVRLKLLAAASKIVQERGVGGLTIADLLARAELGTRAFYRHFDSKDQLVQEVFLGMGRVEKVRLRGKMASAAGPLEAVAAWIDGRLDLVFDEAIRSDLRHLSREAQSQMFAAPELVSPAYREMLKPLIEQLVAGKERGIFPRIDPETDADLLHGAVWACVEAQWGVAVRDRQRIREATLYFCLGGLGVSRDRIAALINRECWNTIEHEE